MSVAEWLALETPETNGPDHPCILVDEHGYMLFWTPASVGGQW